MPLGDIERLSWETPSAPREEAGRGDR